jgi:chromosome segregation ATPase
MADLEERVAALEAAKEPLLLTVRTIWQDISDLEDESKARHKATINLLQACRDDISDQTSELRKLNTRFDQLTTSVDARFEQVDKRFDQLTTSVDARFEQVDRRFERVDTQFDAVMAALAQINTKLDNRNQPVRERTPGPEQSGRPFG